MQRTVLATISSAFLLAGAAALPSAASAAVPLAATPTTPRQVLVVDDGQDCPSPDYASVQAAVDHAVPGALVRVCPGVYTGFVSIDKPLTLLGAPDTIDALDCFDPPTSQADDVDPSHYAILERPQGRPGNLLTVATGGVSVAGLVLQRVDTPVPEAPNITDAAIHLHSGSAGTRIHHNLIQLNDLGVDLGSDGNATTRVDHNCLRDNKFGMASQRQDFIDGLIDNNESFRHAIFAYGVGDIAATRATMFTENISRQDARGFWMLNSPNTPVAPTTITNNHIVNARFQGVFATPDLATSKNVVVTGNEISGTGGTSQTVGLGIAIASNNLGTPAVDGVEIANNVLSNNAVGVSVILNNPGIQVHDNTSNANRQYGIRARFGAPGTPAFGATFTNNTMLENGDPPFDGISNVSDADAFDGTFQGDQSPNTWIGNVCVHDIPVGKICGVS